MALDKETIVRAWKDERFRDSLSEEDRAALPPSPRGDEALSDEDLQAAAGAGLGNLLIPPPQIDLVPYKGIKGLEFS